MNQILLYRLKPRSPFHFGERGVGIESTEDILHSDTLFSSLCCSIVETQGSEALEEFLVPFKKGNPSFLLSSAFPYAGDVLFFPKPKLRLKLDEADVDLVKKYKDIRFLSLKIWEAFVEGEVLTTYLAKDNLLSEGTLWLSDSEREGLPSHAVNRESRPWTKSIVPRVTIDRMSSASAIYHAGRMNFAPDCGLYFFVWFYDDSSRSWLENALLYLGDNGLGGERSSGHGQFNLLPSKPFSLLERETTNFITLSLYSPTLSELIAGLLNSPAGYEIIERRGWIYSSSYPGKYRKSVRMFGEGSVLRGSPHQRHGQMADVTPSIEPAPHTVYRYGFAFPVPVVTEETQSEK